MALIGRRSRLLILAFLLSAGMSAGTCMSAAAESAPSSSEETGSESAAAESAASSSEEADGESAADETAPASPEWVAALPAAKDEKTTQLLIVEGADMESSAAVVSLHARDKDGSWKMMLAAPAYIGRDGMCPDEEHTEGGVFTKTPIGTYHFNKAFGLAEDPGCQLEYIQVGEEDYWSGDDREGMGYNQLVSIRDYPDLDVRSSVHFTGAPQEYRYCLNISFNEEGTPGRGSAIFLRCMGDREYTGGSVAIPEDSMRTVMQEARADCVVVMNTQEGLGDTEGGITPVPAEEGGDTPDNTAEDNAAENAEPEYTAYDAEGMIQGKLVLQSDGYYWFNESLRYRNNGDGSFEGMDTGDVLYDHDITDGTETAASPEQEGSVEVWDENGSSHGLLMPQADSSFYHSEDGKRFAAVGAGSFYGIDTGETLYNYEPAEGEKGGNQNGN